VLPPDCSNAAVTNPELDDVTDEAGPEADPVCMTLVDADADEDTPVDPVEPVGPVGPQLPKSVWVGTVATTRLLEIVL
jgi:hypothetical protein